MPFLSFQCSLRSRLGSTPLKFCIWEHRVWNFPFRHRLYKSKARSWSALWQKTVYFMDGEKRQIWNEPLSKWPIDCTYYYKMLKELLVHVQHPTLSLWHTMTLWLELCFISIFNAVTKLSQLSNSAP